jgi:hypothetical protein
MGRVLVESVHDSLIEGGDASSMLPSIQPYRFITCTAALCVSKCFFTAWIVGAEAMRHQSNNASINCGSSTSELRAKLEWAAYYAFYTFSAQAS